MKTLRTVAVLALGIAVGGIPVGLYYQRQLVNSQTHATVELARQGVLDAVESLTLVREGKIEEFLNRKEEDVSTLVYALSQVVDDSKSTEQSQRLCSMVVRYRNKFPYRTGDTEVDTQVERFLRDAKK